MSEAGLGKTFVLVPGTNLGGWSWHPVARLLRARGHAVVALTLPGLSYGNSPAGLRLADAVDYVAGEVERRDLRDVVLVGHSWGGYPVTGAAHRVAGRVSKVIYYSAVVPARGKSMADENAEIGQAIRASIARSPEGTVPFPLDAVRTVLMPDAPAELQQLVFAMMLPQPVGYVVDALDVPAVTEVGLDAAYVLGADDRALARPGAEFAARLGVEPLLVPGSHMALLTHPENVADAFVSLL